MKKAYSFQPQLNYGCYHTAEAPKLFVRKVSLLTLMKNWIEHHPAKNLKEDDAYYIQCNKNGSIDWPTAEVFPASELVSRNNVFLVRKN